MKILLRQSHFARLFSASLISESGTQLHRVALLFLVYTLTQDALAVSLVLVAQLAATIGMGPLLSAWADSQERRRLLVGSDLLRACLIPLIPIFGIQSFGILLLLVFINEILRNLHDPVANAVVPEVVSAKEDLDAANGLMLFSQRFSEVAMVGFAGLFVALVGAVAAFWFDALTYLVSGLILLGLPRMMPRETKAQDYWQRVRAGFHHLTRHPEIRRTVGCLFAAATFGSVEAVLGVVLAVSFLSMGSAGFGAMEAAMALGAVAGTLLVPRLVKRISREQVFLFGLLLFGLTEASVGAFPIFAWVLFAYLFSGMLNMAFIIPARSILQLNTPPELRTRIFAAFGAVMRSAVLVGTLLGGALEKVMGVATVFAFAGIMVATVALLVLLRTRKPALATLTPDQIPLAS